MGWADRGGQGKRREEGRALFLPQAGVGDKDREEALGRDMAFRRRKGPISALESSEQRRGQMQLNSIRPEPPELENRHLEISVTGGGKTVECGGWGEPSCAHGSLLSSVGQRSWLGNRAPGIRKEGVSESSGPGVALLSNGDPSCWVLELWLCFPG